MEEFDVVVIGAGSGLNVAAACAQEGLKTAIVEKGPMGGTCLNRGCIPSKMVIHAADVMQEIKSAEEYGIDVTVNSIDFASITRWASETVDEDAQNIEDSYDGLDNPKLIKGEARFTGDKEIVVELEDGGTVELKAEKVVLAHGARPSTPPIEGLDDVDYMTSTEALRLEEQPEHLVIVGGGYIAAEMAHFYGSLGTEVTVIQRNTHMIPNEDGEVAERFTELAKGKWDVHLEHTAKAVEHDGDTYTVTVQKKDGSGDPFTIEGDALLVATGVTPNSDTLDLDETGVETNRYGFVENNEYLETTADGIWVLGDAAGNYLFKHAANHEASYVVQNMLDPENKREVDYTAMPHAIFSDPQVAGVGKTEEQLTEEDVHYHVARYEYSNTGMGMAMKADGFAKLLVDHDGNIHGCHIIGPDASTLIHEVLVAMKAGSGKIYDLLTTIHIHPALSEVVQRAAGNVENHHH